MKKVFSSGKKIIIGFTLLLTLSASVYALSVVTEGWKVEKNKTVKIDLTTTYGSGNCKNVTSSTYNVFVPTGKSADWEAFKNNAPNNNIGVTLTNCSATPSCNNNGIKDNGETGIDCGGGSCAACVATPVCGNGVQEAGESCDDGAVNSNSTPGACYTDCSGRVVGSLSCPLGYNDISVGIYSGNCSSECSNGNIRIISKAGSFVANESCASACTPDAHCVNYVKCVYQTCNGTSPAYNEGQCSIGGSISLGCGATVNAASCPPDTPTSQCRFMSVDNTDPIQSAFTTTLNCGPGTQTCWDGSVIPITSSCPHQYTGMWSTGSCSASCGVGTINAPSCSNSDCDHNSEPLSGQSCDTGIACSTPPNHSDTPSCLPCGADITYIRDDYRSVTCGQSDEPVADIVNYDQQWDGTSWTLVSGTYSSIRNRNIGQSCTVGGDLDLGENQLNN